MKILVTQITYDIVSGELLLRLHGRDVEGKRRSIAVHNTRPYFYAEEVPDLEGEVTEITLNAGKNLAGRPLHKVYTRYPSDVPKIRDRYTHYEADVPYTTRCRVDLGIKGEVDVPDKPYITPADIVSIPTPESSIHPVWCSIDIEVDDSHGFADEKRPFGEVLCWSAWHSATDTVYAVVQGVSEFSNDEVEQRLRDIGWTCKVKIVSVPNERELFQRLQTYLRTLAPDVIGGWNCLPKGTPIFMADGSDRLIEDIRIGDRIFGCKNEKVVQGTVLRCGTSYKKTVVFDFERRHAHMTSSTDHKLLVGNVRGVNWLTADKIVPGDYLLLPRSIELKKEYIPPVWKLIPRHRREKVSGTWYRKVGRWGRELLKPLKLSTKHLYMTGLMMTDGSIEDSGRGTFYNTEKALHAVFGGSLRTDLRYKTSRPGSPCYGQTISRILCDIAIGLGIPTGNKTKKGASLSIIFRMPKRYIGAFIAGVIDGDGHIPPISIAQKNQITRQWFRKLLLRIGIQTTCNSESVLLLGCGERSVVNFRKYILPYMCHPKKLRCLKGILSNPPRHYTATEDNYPIGLFKSGQEKNMMLYRNIWQGSSPKRWHARKLGVKEHWKDFTFLRVKRVRSGRKKKCYDIQTTTRNYFASEVLVHNCSKYDIPYLDARSRSIGFRGLHDDLAALVQLDYMRKFDALYKAQTGELESKALDFCSRLVLGKEKLGRQQRTMHDLWMQDPTTLLVYNINDTLLAEGIADKMKIVDYYTQLAQVGGCSIEDTDSSIQLIEQAIFHYLRDNRSRFGVVALPSREKDRDARMEVGGYVSDPVKGIFEWVLNFDLKGEYPSITRTFNVSPETYGKEGYTLPNGATFAKEPRGIYPSLLDEFATYREKLKKDMKGLHPDSDEYKRAFARQEAFKFLMNSFTGVLGNQYFRLANTQIATAIPATCREHVKWMANIIRKHGGTPLYSDTDSCLCTFPSAPPETIVEKGLEVAKALNESFADFAKQYGADSHCFSVDLKKVYSRWFQPGRRKRYVGNIIWEGGKAIEPYIEVKGFEVRRSSSAPYTRKMQKDLFKLIVEGNAPDILPFLREEMRKLEKREVPVEQIAIPIGIHKEYSGEPIQKRAVDYSNRNLGTKFSLGSRINYYFVSTTDGVLPQTDVVAVEPGASPPKGMIIDWNRHIERVFLLPITPVLEGLGLGTVDIMGPRHSVLDWE